MKQSILAGKDKKRLGKDDILKTTQLEENFVTKKYYQHVSKKKTS